MQIGRRKGFVRKSIHHTPLLIRAGIVPRINATDFLLGLLQEYHPGHLHEFFLKIPPSNPLGMPLRLSIENLSRIRGVDPPQVPPGNCASILQGVYAAALP